MSLLDVRRDNATRVSDLKQQVPGAVSMRLLTIVECVVHVERKPLSLLNLFTHICLLRNIEAHTRHLHVDYMFFFFLLTSAHVSGKLGNDQWNLELETGK